MSNSRIKLSLAIVDKFINGIRNQKLMKIASSTGFVKRSDGKLAPSTFFKALTFNMIGINDPTLQVIADACKSVQAGLSISKEAIHQRLVAGASLMEELFKELIKDTFSKASKPFEVKLLEQFSDVLLCDSTINTLSRRIGKLHPGNSGENKGTLKLQTMYSFTKRCFKKIDIFWGASSDISYTKEIAKTVQTGELVIFDLGYMDKRAYNEIIDKKAFFLSRARDSYVYYAVDQKVKYPHKELNIVEILKKSNGNVDLELLVGADPKRRVKCRFIATRLPDEIANERIRKARKRRRREALSAKEIELLKWNTFITNASCEKLPLESICKLYGIRWQIEILFKSCKSHLGIDKLGIGGKAQVQCILYGRLINAVIMSGVFSKCCLYANKKYHRELSILKFFNNIKNRSYELNHIISCYLPSLNGIARFFTEIIDASLYEKRKRKSALQNLLQYTLSG